MRIGFIGAGALGTGLGVLLQKKDYEVTAVYSRSHSSAERFVGQVPGCKACNIKQAELSIILKEKVNIR